MSSYLCWMFNTRGRPIQIRSDKIEEMQGQGFWLVPQEDLNELGRPKQTYYPQYDGQKGSIKKDVVREIENRDRSNILEVEIL